MHEMCQKCVKYMCNQSSCKMHEKLHELLVAASSMQLCVKLPCVCVCALSAGNRFDRLIIKTVSERMRSVFKECLAFVCVMTPMGHIRKLHIREFKHMSFSPTHTFFISTSLTLTLLQMHKNMDSVLLQMDAHHSLIKHIYAYTHTHYNSMLSTTRILTNRMLLWIHSRIYFFHSICTFYFFIAFSIRSNLRCPSPIHFLSGCFSNAIGPLLAHFRSLT